MEGGGGEHLSLRTDKVEVDDGRESSADRVSCGNMGLFRWVEAKLRIDDAVEEASVSGGGTRRMDALRSAGGESGQFESVVSALEVNTTELRYKYEKSPRSNDPAGAGEREAPN